MIEFYKKHFEDYDMNIIDTWDQPRVREFKGKLVKGRYTRGFGSSSFEYAGKLYEPEPLYIPYAI